LQGTSPVPRNRFQSEFDWEVVAAAAGNRWQATN
jgi:hypothetical protein